MKLCIFNTKTKEDTSVNMKREYIPKIKELVQSALTTALNKYVIAVIAESEEEIEFIVNNFHNLRLPAAPASKAMWVNDDAIFIALNYPEQT